MPVALSRLLDLPGRQLVELLQDDAIAVTTAQYGEDIMILRLFEERFPQVAPGFYVDIGAYAPRLISNTFLLSLLGWRGINIDANPDTIGAFARQRPDDVNLCLAIAPADGTRRLHRFRQSSANTISAEQAQRWIAAGFDPVDVVEVPARRLEAVLDEHVPMGRAIDFLNIDIEGLDGLVLEALDFDRYRPKVIAVEALDIDPLHPGNHPIVRDLDRRGYQLMAQTMPTLIFCNRAG
jgi:FkbM family methyltransferase